MDIGLNSPNARMVLRNALAAIEATSRTSLQFPHDPVALGGANHGYFKLFESLPSEPPVDPRISTLASIRGSVDPLVQIRSFILEDIPTTKATIASLLRSSILPAARLIFTLAPENPQERTRNLLAIAALESRSLQFAYKSAEQFTELTNLIPPPEIIEAQAKRHTDIKVNSEYYTESKVIREAGRLFFLSDLEQDTDGLNSQEERTFEEHLSWIFNVYSGLSHGFGWPNLMPHAGDFPGDFVADFSLASHFAGYAIDVAQHRLQPPGTH